MITLAEDEIADLDLPPTAREMDLGELRRRIDAACSSMPLVEHEDSERDE